MYITRGQGQAGGGKWGARGQEAQKGDAQQQQLHVRVEIGERCRLVEAGEEGGPPHHMTPGRQAGFRTAYCLAPCRPTLHTTCASVALYMVSLHIACTSSVLHRPPLRTTCTSVVLYISVYYRSTSHAPFPHVLCQCSTGYCSVPHIIGGTVHCTVPHHMYIFRTPRLPVRTACTSVAPHLHMITRGGR